MSVNFLRVSFKPIKILDSFMKARNLFMLLEISRKLNKNCNEILISIIFPKLKTRTPRKLRTTLHFGLFPYKLKTLFPKRSVFFEKPHPWMFIKRSFWYLQLGARYAKLFISLNQIICASYIQYLRIQHLFVEFLVFSIFKLLFSQ